MKFQSKIVCFVTAFSVVFTYFICSNLLITGKTVIIHYGIRSEGVPPLTIAASLGDVAKVKELIRKGVNLDGLDWLGQSALHMASKFQQSETAHLLLINGANCCIPNPEYQETPLHLAAKTGSLEIIQNLLRHGAKVNTAISPDIIPGGTPLCYAAFYNPLSYSTAKLLLQNGANPNAVNSHGQHVIQLYMHYGNIRVVKMLIEEYNVSVDLLKGEVISEATELKVHRNSNNDLRILRKSHKFRVFPDTDNTLAATLFTTNDSSTIKLERLNNGSLVDVNRQDASGRTALHWAVYGEFMEKVKLLLDGGADVDIEDVTHKQPLHIAAETGNTAMLALLISRGASIDAISDNGTALRIAIEVANSADAVEVLLKHGASIKEDDDEAPLWHLATGKQNIRIIQMLAKQGVDVNTKSASQNQRTALSSLIDNDCCYPQIPVIAALIDVGIDVNSRDASGMTALMIAIAARRRKEVVHYLLERGANPNAVDKKGCNAPLYNLIKLTKVRLDRHYKHMIDYIDEMEDVLASCRMLISAGAKVELVDQCDGKNALDAARLKGLSDVVALLKVKLYEQQKQQTKTPITTAMFSLLPHSRRRQHDVQ